MIKTNLCDYSDAYYIYIYIYIYIRINNTQIDDDVRDIDIVMAMYNLIEFSDVYSKTSGNLWQYYRDEPTLDKNDNIIDFLTKNNNNISFKFKPQITGQTGNSSTKNVEIMVPLKYLSNFWRTLEMLLINCEISLRLKWCKDCF